MAVSNTSGRSSGAGVHSFHRLGKMEGCCPLCPAGCWNIGSVLVRLLCLPSSGPCCKLRPPGKSGARIKGGKGGVNKIRQGGDGLEGMYLRSRNLGEGLVFPEVGGEVCVEGPKQRQVAVCPRTRSW